MVERDEVTLASSFVVFHRDHRDRLVASLALHLQDAHLAAEAVDHAMAKAWGRWDDLDDHGDAGAWVYRVARNWATSWLRRLRFRSNKPVPDRGTTDPPPSGSPELRRAIESLSDAHRAVIVLRLLHEMSTREAALALGVAEGTVRSRMSRALDRLRDHLHESEVHR